MIHSLRSRAAACALLAAPCLHGACTPAPVHGPGQGEALSRAIAVRLRGHRYAKQAAGGVDPESKAPLSSATPLRSGDLFDLELVVDRPAFVLLAHVRPDGSAKLIPVGDADGALEPGTHRIPTDDERYLELGDGAGREVLLLVASPRKIELMDPDLAKLFGALRAAAGAPGPPIGYQPPDVDGRRASDESEGLVFHGRGVIGRKLGPELLAGHADGAGVAAFRIELQHVAP